MTKLTEQEQAEIVEAYLSGLEKGDAFNIPSDLDDPEMINLMKFGKNLRTTNPIVYPKEKKRFTFWKLLVPLPIVGALVAIGVFISFQQAPTLAQLSAEDVSELETELDSIDQLNTELEVALADLDTTLTEIDEILADESFADIEAAINEELENTKEL